MTEKQFLLAYDRRRTSTLTLDSEPGAHTGTTRQYIPGYSDSNIVFLDTVSGNDGNSGATELLAKLTYASAATAAGTTKKIRVINSGAALSTNITKPTEMKRGVSGTIASASTAIDVWSAAATPSFGATEIEKVIYAAGSIDKFIAVARSGKIGFSADGNTWTQSATPSFGSSIVFDVAFNGATLVAVGESGKIATSTDGDTWTQRTSGITGSIYSVIYSAVLGLFVVSAQGSYVAYSSDGVTWTLPLGRSASMIAGIGSNLLAISSRDDTGMIVTGSNVGAFYYSYDAETWFDGTSDSINTIYSITWNTVRAAFIATNNTANTMTSADGITWTQTASTYGGKDSIYIPDYDKYMIGYTSAYEIAFSSDGLTWTEVGTPATTSVNGLAYSPEIGFAVAVGSGGVISKADLITTDISADVAGFSISAVSYTGTIKAYNCTLTAPTTTAALSMDSCRVIGVSRITNNAITSLATLFEGDRNTTCTPAAQNAIDCNLDTVGGTWYIYNASATGFERVRDCLVTGGIVANFNVTVGGRANIQGDSENILIDAEVTTDDPKFVDTTDYKLQFQTNGYARNSLAAGRSAIYFNSAGSPRDIGAWSYVESAVSYFFAKSAVLYKGEITHEIEETVSEQQGDSGVVSVYGNANRIKEIITISYGDTREVDRAPFEYIRLLKDKGVKLILDAEWESNAGTVTVNGNQAAGVEFLTVDSCIYYNGLWVTVAGKRYWIMRASPSNTAATKLILDRPLEDAVSDNDVLTTNYPPGVGEYQFAGLARLQLKRKAPDGLKGWQTGLQLRFVRKYQ